MVEPKVYGKTGAAPTRPVAPPILTAATESPQQYWSPYNPPPVSPTGWPDLPAYLGISHPERLAPEFRPRRYEQAQAATPAPEPVTQRRLTAAPSAKPVTRSGPLPPMKKALGKLTPALATQLQTAKTPAPEAPPEPAGPKEGEGGVLSDLGEVWDRIRGTAEMTAPGVERLGRSIAGETGAEVGKVVGGVAGGAVSVIGQALGTVAGGVDDIFDWNPGTVQNWLFKPLQQGAATVEQAIGSAFLITMPEQERKAQAEYERYREEVQHLEWAGRTNTPEYAQAQENAQRAERVEKAIPTIRANLEGYLQPFRMTGQERRDVWEAARSGTYTGLNLPAAAYERIRAGEDVETVVHDVAEHQDILKEFLGQSFLDPLLAVGKFTHGARQGYRLADAFIAMNKESKLIAAVGTAPEALREADTARYAALVRRYTNRPWDLFNHTPDAERQLLNVRSNAIYGQVMKGVVNDAERAQRFLDFAKDPYAFSVKYDLPPAISEAGISASNLLHRFIQEHGGMTSILKAAAEEITKRGWDGPEFQARRYDVYAQRLLDAMATTTKKLIPDFPSIVDPITKHILTARARTIDPFLAAAYMGTSPLYSARNALNNLVTGLVDGFSPFDSIEEMNKVVARIGAPPVSRLKGIGGTGVEAKKTLWNTFLRVSQAGEKVVSNRVATRAFIDAFRDLYTPRAIRYLDEAVQLGLSPETTAQLRHALMGAMNETELKVQTARVFGGQVYGGTISPEDYTALAKMHPALAMAMREAVDGSPSIEALRARAKAIEENIAQWQEAENTPSKIMTPVRGSSRHEMTLLMKNAGWSEAERLAFLKSDQYRNTRLVYVRPARDFAVLVDDSIKARPDLAPQLRALQARVESSRWQQHEVWANGPNRSRNYPGVVQSVVKTYNDGIAEARRLIGEAPVRPTSPFLTGEGAAYAADPRVNPIIAGAEEAAQPLPPAPAPTPQGVPVAPEVVAPQAVSPALQGAPDQATRIRLIAETFNMSEEQAIGSNAILEATADHMVKLTGRREARQEFLDSLLFGRMGDAEQGLAQVAQRVQADLPPVPEGHIRLFRGEGVPTERAAEPHRAVSWPSGAITGSWFGRSLEDALWYVEFNANADVLPGEARTGRVFYIDLPTEQAERFLVANWPQGEDLLPQPRKFSFRHGNEYFLPVMRDRTLPWQEKVFVVPREYWAPMYEKLYPGANYQLAQGLPQMGPARGWITPEGKFIDATRREHADLLIQRGRVAGPEGQYRSAWELEVDAELEGWIRLTDGGLSFSNETAGTIERVNNTIQTRFDTGADHINVDYGGTPHWTAHIYPDDWARANHSISNIEHGRPLFQGPLGTFLAEGGKRIIKGATDANVSTGFHEFGHVYMDAWVEALRQTGKVDPTFTSLSAELRKLGAVIGEGDVWDAAIKDVKQNPFEVMSYALEHYFWTGQAPTPEMANIFQRIMRWMHEVYQSIKGTNLEGKVASSELKRILDERFGKPVAEALQRYDVERAPIPERAAVTPTPARPVVSTAAATTAPSIERRGGEGFHQWGIQEALARYQEGAERAAQAGLPYHTPADEYSYGAGWKLHLNTVLDFDDPLVAEIVRFLDDRQVDFKVGMGGEAGEKGMTIYAGPRDVARALATEIQQRFGDRLPEPPVGLAGDAAFTEKVYGRFDLWHGKADRDFTAYGPEGTLKFAKWVEQVLQYPGQNQRIHDAATAYGHYMLSEKYGAFYYGSDRWQPPSLARYNQALENLHPDLARRSGISVASAGVRPPSQEGPAVAPRPPKMTPREYAIGLEDMYVARGAEVIGVPARERIPATPQEVAAARIIYDYQRLVNARDNIPPLPEARALTIAEQQAPIWRDRLEKAMDAGGLYHGGFVTVGPSLNDVDRALLTAQEAFARLYGYEIIDWVHHQNAGTMTAQVRRTQVAATPATAVAPAASVGPAAEVMQVLADRQARRAPRAERMAAAEGVAPGPTPPVAVPDQATLFQEAPTAADDLAVADEMATLVRQVTQNVVNTWQTNPTKVTMTPEIAAWYPGWISRISRDMNTAKAAASRIGTEARNFALLDYTDRRSIDTLLAAFFIYPYWSSRTYPNWVKRALMNPGVAAAYLRYQNAVREGNKDQPPWLQDELRLNLDWIGLPQGISVNVRKMIDPMYQLFSTFEDPQREETGLGRAIADVTEKTGLSVHPLFTYLYATERYLAKRPEAARAALGHLSGSTRFLRYLTGRLGINDGVGFVPEPWLWRGGFGIGGDKWEMNRVTRELANMEKAGEITAEEARQAAYDMSQSKFDNPIVRRGMAREIDKRFLPTLMAYTFGSVRITEPEDAEIDKAQQARADLYAQRPSMSEEDFSARLSQFYHRYPYMSVISLGRAAKERGDTLYVWDVLNRLPPNQADAIMEGLGVKPAVLSAFRGADEGKAARSEYDGNNFVNVEGKPVMTETDRARLLAATLDLAAQYNLPSQHMSAQWAEVKQRYSDMYAYADRKFPGSRRLWTQYFDIKTRDPEAAKDFLDATPILGQRRDWIDNYKQSDPVLMWFYGDNPREQAIQFIWGVYWSIPKAQRSAYMRNFGSEFANNFLGKKYDRVSDGELFTVVTLLGGTLYRTQPEGQQSVAPRNTVVQTPEQMQWPTPQTLLAQLPQRVLSTQR